VAVDKHAIEGAESFQLDGQCPGEHDIRAGADRQMQVCLFGHPGTTGIDDDEPGRVTLGGVDLAHQVQIAHARVVAPDDDQLSERHLL
jgi:hypothetical protein